MSQHAPWERAFDKVVTPFEEFIHHESTSGLLLMACAVLALILANTALHDSYEHILHTRIAFSVGGWRLEHSLHHWINDGLMWLLFFLVGLEIKREVLVGQLSDLRQALLLVGALVALNRLGIRSPIPYFLFGILLWMAFLESGVHATVAGILAAWTIPARSKFDSDLFGEKIEALGQRMQQRRAANVQCTVMEDEDARRGVIQTLLDGVHMVETPLQRLEHGLHIPVAFMIVPLFALANAGIPLHLDQIPAVLSNPITLGIIAGMAGFLWLRLATGRRCALNGAAGGDAGLLACCAFPGWPRAAPGSGIPATSARRGRPQ